VLFKKGSITVAAANFKRWASVSRDVDVGGWLPKLVCGN